MDGTSTVNGPDVVRISRQPCSGGQGRCIRMDQGGPRAPGLGSWDRSAGSGCRVDGGIRTWGLAPISDMHHTTTHCLVPQLLRGEKRLLSRVHPLPASNAGGQGGVTPSMARLSLCRRNIMPIWSAFRISWSRCP